MRCRMMEGAGVAARSPQRKPRRQCCTRIGCGPARPRRDGRGAHGAGAGHRDGRNRAARPIPAAPSSFQRTRTGAYRHLQGAGWGTRCACRRRACSRRRASRDRPACRLSATTPGSQGASAGWQGGSATRCRQPRRSSLQDRRFPVPLAATAVGPCAMTVRPRAPCRSPRPALPRPGRRVPDAHGHAMPVRGSRRFPTRAQAVARSFGRVGGGRMGDDCFRDEAACHLPSQAEKYPAAVRMPARPGGMCPRRAPSPGSGSRWLPWTVSGSLVPPPGYGPRRRR